MRPAIKLTISVVAAMALLALAAVPALGEEIAPFGFRPGTVGEVAVNGNREPVSQPQAGGHPFGDQVSITFNTRETPYHFEEGASAGGSAIGETTSGNAKDIQVELPSGFLANVHAVPQCSAGDFTPLGFGGAPHCPVSTQIGTADLVVGIAPSQSQNFTQAVYNLVPPKGKIASIGFNAVFPVIINVGIRSGGDYGVTTTVKNISEGANLFSTVLTLWGVPTAASHDAERYLPGSFLPGEEGRPIHLGLPEKPFLRYPTQCETPITARFAADSWQEPGNFVSAVGASQELSGCNGIPFAPSISATPTVTAADSPSGLDVHVHLPQNEVPSGVATSDLRAATVTLPEGMRVNASSANGLGTCAEAEIDLTGPGAATCPDNSKIGEVEIDSPLIDHPLQGGVYLAKQRQNKFGSLLAIYLAVDDPQTGIVIKLPGKVETTSTGQVVTTFDENPQLPFEDLHVMFFGGPRASLITPASCGTYTTSARLTPWSGTPAVTANASFQITSGPNGGGCPAGVFNPKLSAGTANPLAGASSPLVIHLSREDGTQQITGLDLSMPEGLLGKLAGIPYCSEASLAAVPGTEGSASTEIASPSCPAASQVGEVSVSAGAGASPFDVDTGKVYLAGPYKGAPISLVFVTPALAGPFDLGNVLVRTALRIDPITTRITAVSDPLPTILYGIPLDLRTVDIDLDRPDFTLNPTSCDPMAVSGSASSPSGATAPISDRFQVGSCERLGLAPKLALKFSGAPTRRGGHPKLTATLTTKAGEANLKRVQVTLPKTEYLENAHIRTVCTRVQYAANQCPAKSIYGYAKAWTPLLDKPLEGPVYLRSSSHKLPDLVASLDGQIHVDLDGRISSNKARIRNTFDLVPDAPVSKFVLTMQGGGKGLLVNNTNLCKAKPVASVEFNGQNGKVANTDPLVSVGGCGGKKAKPGKKKH